MARGRSEKRYPGGFGVQSFPVRPQTEAWRRVKNLAPRLNSQRQQQVKIRQLAVGAPSHGSEPPFVINPTAGPSLGPDHRKAVAEQTTLSAADLTKRSINASRQSFLYLRKIILIDKLVRRGLTE